MTLGKDEFESRWAAAEASFPRKCRDNSIELDNFLLYAYRASVIPFRSIEVWRGPGSSLKLTARSQISPVYGNRASYLSSPVFKFPISVVAADAGRFSAVRAMDPLKTISLLYICMSVHAGIHQRGVDEEPLKETEGLR